MTHKELVKIGKKWLWPRCEIVVTELTTGISETPDVIGWHGGVSTLIECKTNRQDFLKDKHKYSRRSPGIAVGNYRYYLTSPGVIRDCEIPEKWGLLEVDKKEKIYCPRKAQYFKTEYYGEITILVSCIKRIGQNPPEGISVKAYKYKTKRRASIGVKED